MSQKTQRGMGFKIGQKSVTHYLNGPLKFQQMIVPEAVQLEKG
jgi:hypothetical protein